jgi:alginate O-acetyltransferase complex protein AlgI
MVFSSPLFILLFLPIVLALYYLVNPAHRNAWLLVASLAFYAWGEGYYTVVLLLCILLNWSFGMAILWAKTARSRQVVLVIGVVLNLSMLIGFKYSNFLVENFNFILAGVRLKPLQLKPVHLPIGISFFVFQGISYLADVHRKDVKPTQSLLDFAMYKSFFPQLIAGPIVRYRDVSRQIEQRIASAPQFAEGVQRFIVGLGKKVIVANTAAIIADKVFAEPATTISAPVAWLGVAAYALQIYFDFSGYSDMAIGMAKMFGFDFLENFDYPYISRSIKEFWRRWHISLSSWFRDYLYIPLGGSRVSVFRQYMNLLIVFVLCGLWHGASWAFLVWGLWNGLFLVLERTSFGKFLDRLPIPVRHAYALLVTLVGWVFFRAVDFTQALSYLAAMAGQSVVTDNLNVGLLLDPYMCFVLTLGVVFATPVVPWLRARWQTSAVGARHFVSFTASIIHLAVLVVLLVFSLSSLAMGTNNPFIYFRF